MQMKNKKINLKTQKFPARRFMLLFITIMIFIIFSILLPNTFPTRTNIMTIFRQGSIYGIVILGVTWILAMGEIDVSFPEIAAFSSVLSAILIKNGVPLDLAATISILLGSIFGLLSGMLVSQFRLASLIVTIAVAGLAKSAGMILGRGTTVPITKQVSSFFYNVVWGSTAGIPNVFIVFTILAVLMMIIQDRLKFGHYIYAIGDNKEVALLAGIKVGRVQRIVFFISAFFGSLGGVFVMLMVSSGQPTIGSTLFLDSFTKLFLGALFIKMGKTNIAGTFVSVIMMAMLVNGLTQMGSPSFISQIITGILLVIGVTLTSILHRRYLNSMQLEV
jgi:ribose transport system permease protein